MSVPTRVSRRDVLLVGSLGVGGLALTACAGSSAKPKAATPAKVTSTPTTVATKVMAVADVPVGGSVNAIVNGQPVVLAQPTAGTVVCFSALCTHAGCPVKTGSLQLHCDCHGSSFDAATGAVLQGPATEPLAKVAVSVEGTDVVTS